jgi:hypothetical protein
MVKMLDRNNGFNSIDPVVSALNWLALNAPDVRIVNMSIGTTALFTGYCDSATAWTMSLASAVATLHARGVTLFAAAGNDTATVAMAAPACIRDVVSVGAVYDSAYGSDQVVCRDPSAADKVTCFSDSSPALDLLAPGALITSTGLRSRGSPLSTYLGTSQASPHAAAAAAVLLQARPTLTPLEVEGVLNGSGTPLTDRRNGRVTPRIDALAALTLPVLPHTLTVTNAGSGSGSVTSDPAGVDCGSSCSYTFGFGLAVTLTRRPAPGSIFKRWSGACSGTGACMVSMAADRAVTALFDRIMCVVPNVVGKKLPAARTALRTGHCKLGKVTRVYSSRKKGRVLSQRPKGHRTFTVGTAVAVTVSRGSKPR